jgi:8-amino-7-oxononanoate synthase
MALSEHMKNYTHQLKQQGLLRSRQVLDPAYTQFDSNDYLSLTHDKRISQAYEHGYKCYPSGSGGSMLLSGYHANHQDLEQAFANLLAVDECVLLSSGYAANLAITALLGKVQAHCIIDKKIHASIYDGLSLSQVPYSRFIHNNLEALEKVIINNSSNSVVLTEGIFSMSGQIAPLSNMAALCHSHQVDLVVDEAHSFGVLGEQGKGTVDFHHLTQEDVPLRVIPFGKAFAAQGALVAGKKEWVDALLQAGRSIIYSTSISPALSYGLLKTLDVVVGADDRRKHLRLLIELFNQHIKSSPLDWSSSETPIQQLLLGCPQRALYYADELKKNGFSCSAIRAPTVNTQSTGLRIILNYCHTPEKIQQLFNQLHLINEHTSH